MVVEQLSIFLENKAGRLMEVTGALAEAEIDIFALSLADTSDFGILRIIVDNSEKAQMVLRDRGLTVSKTQVVGVQVSDKPGGLHHILNLLGAANINVEYMYAFIQRQSSEATMIFRFDRIEAALEELQKQGIPIISTADLVA